MKICKIRGGAQTPIYASEGAACFDLFACMEEETRHLLPGAYATVHTGLVFEIPEGYYLAIFSRSGHALRYRVRLANCTGIVDSDYRGEIMVMLHNDSEPGDEPFIIKPGDRIAQAMLQKVERVVFEDADYKDLSKTARGSGGFGSTGDTEVIGV